MNRMDSSIIQNPASLNATRSEYYYFADFTLQYASINRTAQKPDKYKKPEISTCLNLLVM